MDADVFTLATQALTRAWIWRWAAILGVGALPWVAGRIWPELQGTEHFRSLRRVTAAAGFVLCLMALPLALDTFTVELQEASGLNRVLCTIAQSPQSRWDLLTCEEGDFFFVERMFDAIPGDVVDVVYLPWSRTAVQLQPIGR